MSRNLCLFCFGHRGNYTILQQNGSEILINTFISVLIMFALNREA